MPTPHEPADATRVLAVVLHPTYSGLAVIDRWGLVAFVTWNFYRFRTETELLAALDRALLRALADHRPAYAVVATSRRDDPRARPMLRTARRVLAKAGVPVVIRSVATGRHLLLGRIKGDRPDDLPDRIARGFFPDLARWLRVDAAGRYEHPDHERAHFRRHAWHAVALALDELVRRHPGAAFALAHPAAFERETRDQVTPFGKAVADADERRRKARRKQR